jgi:F-type H+-transporting ATPase subunit delta
MAAHVLGGNSRDALLEAESSLEAVLGAATPKTDPEALAEDLFSVTELLGAQPALRRALTDPGRSGPDRSGLVEHLLGGRVSPAAVGLVSGLAASRWSDARDIVDVTERLAVNALLVAAENAGRLDAVEDELFRFGRLVAGDAGLRDAFSQRTSGARRKADLVGSLLAGKAAPETVRLARHAVLAPGGVSAETAITSYVESAARRRSQLIAEVTSAVPLTAAQLKRLVGALTKVYGRAVKTSTEVDDSLVGGLTVTIAGEVIDASLLSRISTVRQRLAG